MDFKSRNFIFLFNVDLVVDKNFEIKFGTFIMIDLKQLINKINLKIFVLMDIVIKDMSLFFI